MTRSRSSASASTPSAATTASPGSTWASRRPPGDAPTRASTGATCSSRSAAAATSAWSRPGTRHDGLPARPHRASVRQRGQRVRHRGQCAVDGVQHDRGRPADVGLVVGFDKHPRGAFDPDPALARTRAVVRRERLPRSTHAVLRHEDQPLHARLRHHPSSRWRRWRRRRTATVRRTRTPGGASR